MKTIDTLCYDIEQTLLGLGGVDKAVAEVFGKDMAEIFYQRFHKPAEVRKYLSLSSIGTPCSRKLWYKVNMGDKAEALGAEAIGTFFYGDMIEALVIALAKASGHDVKGEQTKLNVHGIIGHRDCVIDGVTIDVKSASKYSFQKFANGELRGNDPFGYISQLSSYVYAGRDDDLVTDKTSGAFLVVQKDRFKLCLDRYDFTEELKNKEQEIVAAKALVVGRLPEERLPTVPQSKTSPNTMLDTTCNYCEFRKICWPEARTFAYSTGYQHLVDVVKEPNVVEIIE